jgi:hypothetical protein
MENSDLFKVASLVLATACVFLISDNSSLRKQYEEQLELSYWDRSVIDSLHGELYIKDLELSNYVQMWATLEEVAPSLADSINNQVE